MSENLNENLYNRFGLQLEKRKVESGFRKHITNLMWTAFYPIYDLNYYKPEFKKSFEKAREIILREGCKQFFLDLSDYPFSPNGVQKFQWEVFNNYLSFEEFLLRIQVILNMFWDCEIMHEELKNLSEEIQKYICDFPILGIIIKRYKIKSPQILTSISKRLEKEIIDTLGVLDSEKFKSALDDFEVGIRNFTKAKTDSQFKDVIEDMHGSCDEIVKIILNNKNKSFKHATDKVDHKLLGLNGHQKEIYKNLKNWMDDIKHGSKKNVDRNEVEMIISMSAAFLRFVAIKHQNNKK